MYVKQRHLPGYRLRLRLLRCGRVGGWLCHGLRHIEHRFWASLKLLEVVDDVVALELFVELGVVAHVQVVGTDGIVAASFKLRQSLPVFDQLLAVILTVVFSFSHALLIDIPTLLPVVVIFQVSIWPYLWWLRHGYFILPD